MVGDSDQKGNDDGMKSGCIHFLCYKNIICLEYERNNLGYFAVQLYRRPAHYSFSHAFLCFFFLLAQCQFRCRLRHAVLARGKERMGGVHAAGGRRLA